MLSIKRVNQDTYFTQANPQDYYAEESTGIWFGQGATAFGLEGAIDANQFQNLFYGYSPFDGNKPLVQNAGQWKRVKSHHDRTTFQERRHAWDLTFSAPKSVSTLWGLSSAPLRQQISQCHTDAIHEVLTWAEQEFGKMRRGRNGVRVEQAHWVIGLFQHGTSRELDPQLHTHCCLMAVGITQEGETGQIESYALYRYKRLLGAAYRAALAMKLEQLGFMLRPHQEGHVKSFELAEVPQKVIYHFSKRSQQIKDALKAQGYEQPNPKAAERLTLFTRKAKAPVEVETLFEKWQQEASALGYKPLLGMVSDPTVASVLPDVQATTVKQALHEMTSHHSHFSRYDLLQTTLEAAQLSGIGFEGSLTAINDWIAITDIWQGQPDQAVKLAERQGEIRYSTQSMVQLEQAMLEQVKRLATLPALPVEAEIVRQVIAARDPARLLRDDQQQALWTLTTGNSRINVLTGVPGAGKTEVLGEAYQVWCQAGYRVIGINFQGRTAADLEHKTGIPSDTIHKTLNEIEKGSFTIDNNLSALIRSGKATEKQQKLYQYQLERLRYQIDHQTVVVLDEGSMVDTILLKRIVDVIESANAQLILAGDANQLPAIGPGGGFAAISQLVPCATLTEPIRQQVDWQREQTKQLVTGNVETAIRTYHHQGRLQIADNPALTQKQLITDWQQYGTRQPQDYVILAMTNAAVATYNHAAQEARLLAGAIGGSSIAVGGTTFYEGDRILFRRLGNAEEAIIPFRRYGVRNGQFATIEQIHTREAQISVRLDNSQRFTIPVDEFPHFRLGYAGTTYFFQGESVVQTFVQVGGFMQDLEQTVVQLTRHKQDVRLYTDLESAGEDLKTLLKQMQRSRQKELAVQVQSLSYGLAS